MIEKLKRKEITITETRKKLKQRHLGHTFELLPLAQNKLYPDTSQCYC